MSVPRDFVRPTIEIPAPEEKPQKKRRLDSPDNASEKALDIFSPRPTHKSLPKPRLIRYSEQCQKEDEEIARIFLGTSKK